MQYLRRCAAGRGANTMEAVAVGIMGVALAGVAAAAAGIGVKGVALTAAPKNGQVATGDKR